MYHPLLVRYSSVVSAESWVFGLHLSVLGGDLGFKENRNGPSLLNSGWDEAQVLRKWIIELFTRLFFEKLGL